MRIQAAEPDTGRKVFLEAVREEPVGLRLDNAEERETRRDRRE